MNLARFVHAKKFDKAAIGIIVNVICFIELVIVINSGSVENIQYISPRTAF